MSTATLAAPASKPVIQGKSHLLFRRLHSLAGIMFGGYIIVHLLVNATLIEGHRVGGQPTVFQQQVDKIHSLPFLIPVEWTAIFFPLIYHTIYGIWITVTGQPNVNKYGYGKNWAYTLQRITAIVLVLFIAFHVLGMKGVFGGDVGKALTFAPEVYATESTINHMHAAWWVGYVVYPVGILAATFHLANGFWTAGITWGLTVSKGSQRRWGVVCAGLFLMTSACGFAALGATLKASPVALPAEVQAEFRDPKKSVLPSPSDAIKAGENAVTGNDRPMPSK